MAYKIQSSEKLRKSGSEAETKALLYLMNFRSDSDEIYYFVVDFFNDLTGMDRIGQKLWDVQSKGAHNVGPKAAGQELVTLFKNYMSSLDFKAYIFFMGSVSSTLRIDPTWTVFGITDLLPFAIDQIKEGLRQEGTDKEYIDNASLTDANITDFLSKIVFVIDDDKRPSEYVKAIIKQHPNIIPEERILDAISNEIRDKQASKENVCNVEGVIIETSDEALNYSRHLTNNEICLMTLQRIINRDPISKGIPPSFVYIYSAWPPERAKDTFDDCQGSLCRALFNKSAADGFWSLFENTYNLIIQFPTESVQYIYTHLDNDCISRCPDFDALSLKYFIASVKDGIQQ